MPRLALPVKKLVYRLSGSKLPIKFVNVFSKFVQYVLELQRW